MFFMRCYPTFLCHQMLKSENISVFIWYIGKCFRYLYNKTKGIFPKQKIKLKIKLKIMKTYTKQVTTENITVIGGIDHNGVKGDLLEVLEVNRPWGETVGQIYFLTESTSDELPIKTFPSVEEAISACRSEIRKIKMTMGDLNMKKMILDL